MPCEAGQHPEDDFQEASALTALCSLVRAIGVAQALSIIDNDPEVEPERRRGFRKWWSFHAQADYERLRRKRT